MQRTCVFTGLALALTLLSIFSLSTSLSARAQAKPRDVLLKQHFSCNSSYELDECLTEISILKTDLADLPIEQLGEWSWILVRSRDWKTISEKLEIDPRSPAFTCLELRETFIEEALLRDVPERTETLVVTFQMSRERLRLFAVAHEFAHGLCNDKNELKANYLAWLLLGHRSFSCLGKIK